MKAKVSEVRSPRQQRLMDNVYHGMFTKQSTEGKTIFINLSHYNSKISASYWAGFWDVNQEGHFESVNDGAAIGSHQPWYSGEPNGGKVENCLVVWPNRGLWNDVDCGKRFSTFCDFEEAPYLQIRGIKQFL